MNNISVKYKLFFMVLLPLAFFMVLAGSRVYELNTQSTRQAHVVKLMQTSVTTSNLIHELQKERGASAGFIGSKGKKFSDVLPKQRKLTDEKIAELEKAVAKMETSAFGREQIKVLLDARVQLNEIKKIRARVDRLNITVAENVGYYSGLIHSFFDITKRAIFLAEKLDLKHSILAYYNFLQSKERAGLERAIGAVGFGGGWNVSLMIKFSNLITIQNLYLQEFKVYASSDVFSFYANKAQSKAFKDVLAMRSIALDVNREKTVEAQNWFTTITKKINHLKDVENYIANNVIMLAEQGALDSASYRDQFVYLVLFLILIVAGMSFVVFRDFLANIMRAVNVLDTLSAGKQALNIHGVNRKDEFGSLMRSAKTLNDLTVKSFAQAQMIQQMPMAVMTASPKTLELNYMNEQSYRILKVIESSLPNKVDELIGKPLDVLHGDLANQRELLANPDALPHKLKLVFDNEFLEINISAIHDVNGEYAGLMITLENITKKENMANVFDKSVGGVIKELTDAASVLENSANNMQNIAKKTAESSASVASSSEDANENVSGVNSAMSEMSAASQEIATQITNANTKSNDTASNAESANETVKNLNELVENIGVVVMSIKDIADQTNLLALNATIESARAGEAGKGFAVVAGEVKKLANETSIKTEEIENRIAEIKAATSESVMAMQNIINNISEMDQYVTGISAAVQEQNATNGQIVQRVAEASQGVKQVSEVIKDVQKGADETGNSAEGVLIASQNVAKISDKLKISVNDFLNEVRDNNSSADSTESE